MLFPGWSLTLQKTHFFLNQFVVTLREYIRGLNISLFRAFPHVRRHIPLINKVPKLEIVSHFGKLLGDSRKMLYVSISNPYQTLQYCWPYDSFQTSRPLKSSNGSHFGIPYPPVSTGRFLNVANFRDNPVGLSQSPRRCMTFCKHIHRHSLRVLRAMTPRFCRVTFNAVDVHCLSLP